MKKIASILCSIVLCLSIVGCGGSTKKDNDNKDTMKNSPTNETKVESKEETKEEEIVLKFFSNVADRQSGVGMLEELVANRYMEEHPNVKIEFECLDGEAFKQKFTAYLTSNDLPDIFMSWGLPSWVKPIIDNGYAAELNMDDYKDYGFIPGSLDGFMSEGRLYGLPKVMDFMVMYYNEDIYKKCGLEVPKSFDDITKSINTINEKGYDVISMDGKDGWPLGLYFHDIFVKVSGDQKLMNKVLNKEVKAKDVPEFLEAAKVLAKMGKDNMFQESYLTADYGAAINLFGQEKSAMFYMGSWATTIARDESYSEDFRKHAKVMNVPEIEDGNGNSHDLVAWFGGGYQVSALSEHKDVAIDLLNFIMRPENWAKEAWQQGVALPVQNVEPFLNGKETEMQLELVNMIKTVESSSGVPWIDYLTPAFKTDVMTALQELVAGLISPEEFVDKVDKAVDDVE